MSHPKRREVSGEMALLEAILTDRPNLEGAACIGRYELFDATDADSEAYRHAAAEAMCWRCPVRSKCPDSLAREGNTAA